jgi:hypothetical protein
VRGGLPNRHPTSGDTPRVEVQSPPPSPAMSSSSTARRCRHDMDGVRHHAPFIPPEDDPRAAWTIRRTAPIHMRQAWSVALQDTRHGRVHDAARCEGSIAPSGHATARHHGSEEDALPSAREVEAVPSRSGRHQVSGRRLPMWEVGFKRDLGFPAGSSATPGSHLGSIGIFF